MRTINESVPPAAIPLVGRALIEAPERPVPEAGLISRARSLTQGEPLDYEAALHTLIVRRLISAGREGYSPAPGSEKFLAFYANSAYR